MYLIVAADKNWGIGFKGTQPIVLPEDRKFFRETTAGSAVIVGDRTVLDFPGGKPLPNRKNIIMSVDPEYTAEGAVIVHSLKELAEVVREETGKVFVIGGASIYKLLLPYCDTAYITRIDAEFDADRYLDDLDKADGWYLAEKGRTQIRDGIRFSFDTYKNRTPEIL